MLKRKNEDAEDVSTKRVAMDATVVEAAVASAAVPLPAPAAAPVASEFHDSFERSTPISSHKVPPPDDPTYVHFRMLVPVKEAGLIVGKGGEKINYIKEQSGAKINVSENLKGVYERVIHVKGPAEKVAKAFGLMTRVILDEPETPSSPNSKQYVLKILVPDSVIGVIIGKAGSKFREIEDKSAARLKASEQTLGVSTDRCLQITGVPDAIHIAAYYVAQTIYENKKYLSKGKITFYTPGAGGYGMTPPPYQYGQSFQFGAYQPNSPMSSHNPMSTHNPMNNPMNTQMMGNMGMMPPMGMGYMRNGTPGRDLKPYGQPYMQQRPNRLLSMPPSQVNHIMYASHTPSAAPPPAPPLNFVPLPLNPQNQTSMEIFLANDCVGSVIGKGGKNIKEIRDHSGSQIKVQDVDPDDPSERKVVITGPAENNKMAVYLINNRIEMDRQKNLEKEQGHSQRYPGNGSSDGGYAPDQGLVNQV